MKRVMILGLGALGGYVLEFLVRQPRVIEIITADVNEDWGSRRTNSSILGAAQMGFFPKVRFQPLDMSDVGRLAEFLRVERPDIVVNLSTLQSWWVVGEVLPKELADKIDEAKLGPWTPMHLALTYTLMKAVRLSGIETLVINGAFSDVVNPALAKVGLAPTIGVGNLDNRIPEMCQIVGAKLGVHPANVMIFWVAAHYVTYRVMRFGETGGAPHFLKIMVGDKDVTEEVGVDYVLQEIPRRWARCTGQEASALVASSVVKNILAMVDDRDLITHSPGPEGLPGGYPVRIGAQGARVFLPAGISLEEAIRINMEGLRYDGIEAILDDGTIIFTDKAVSIMKKYVGYDCRPLKVEESLERSRELRERLNALIKAHR
jgi:hypothetical protein